MLDEDEDEGINPMETEAGATMKDEYDLLEPTHRILESTIIGKSKANPYANFVAAGDLTNRSLYFGNEDDFAEGT
jgi:hypothetical protein